MKRVLLICAVMFLATAPVFAEIDDTVRLNAGGFSATAGNRMCADLVAGQYVVFGRGAAYQNGMITRGNISGSTWTWTQYVDSTLAAGGASSFQLTMLNDSLYWSSGQDAVPYRGARIYYNSSTTRDTAQPRDTLSTFATAAPSGGAFQVNGDTVITYSDDSSGTTIRPVRSVTGWANNDVAWAEGTRHNLGASAGNAYGFPLRNVIGLYSCGSGGHDFWVTDGVTVDSVPGGGSLLLPEGDVAANVSFVARDIHDSVFGALWELNDSLVMRLFKLGGDTYPYSITALTAAVRVDARVAPTGDAVAGGRKEGRLAMLGNTLYAIYKDWRNTANVDSVDICERHISLTSIPADLTGLSSEAILRHAVDGFLIVEMNTPERYNSSRALLWEVWRDNAAVGSRSILAHVDTVTAAPSGSNVTVQRSGVQQSGIMCGQQ